MISRVFFSILFLAMLFGQNAQLWISAADQDSIQVSMTNDMQVCGFQVTIMGDERLDPQVLGILPGGSAQEAGFVQTLIGDTNTILAFSFTGDCIPAGESVLFTMSWELLPASGWVWLEIPTFGDGLPPWFSAGDPYWISICDELEFNMGDVNGDGGVDVLDIVLVITYILGDMDFTPEQVCAFDFVQDGVINVLDIVYYIVHAPDGW